MGWRLDKILYQKEKPFWVRGLLLPLSLLSILYGVIVRTKVFLYSTNVRTPKSLPCPVICVGNITVGGTGKTPLVMALATWLTDKGIPIAILSRGYKGTGGSGPLVTDGQTIFLSLEESGDEPFLMAKALKDVPVLIGKDRFVTGRMALERFGVRGLLLDDGYQHLRLHRDLNILLIDSQIGFGDYHLLPRGILREPLDHLRRAHLFLLTKVENPGTCRILEKEIQQIHPSAPIFHSHYKPQGFAGPNGEWEDLHSMKGKKALALSGIANPDYFAFLLKRVGLEVVAEAIFPDHHLFTPRDLAFIVEKSKGADWVVTTEKDLVKLEKIGIHHLPIRALRIQMKIWEEEDFCKWILEIF